MLAIILNKKYTKNMKNCFQRIKIIRNNYYSAPNTVLIQNKDSKVAKAKIDLSKASKNPKI